MGKTWFYKYHGCSLLLADDALEGEFLLHPGEVGGVGVPEVRRTAASAGLMVYSVPNYLIVEAGSDATADSEGESAVEGFLEQIQHFVAFGGVGQVGDAGGASEGLPAANARVEAVADDDGALRVPLADHILIDIYSHLPVGLVASHVSEDSGADGTLGPVLLADEHEEAVSVVLVRAAKHENVVVVLLLALPIGGLDHELLQTDHALLVLHLAAGQRELDRVEVADFEDVVVVLAHAYVLLVDHLYQKLDGFEQLVVALDRVLRGQHHLLLVRPRLLHEELAPLLSLHCNLRNSISKNQTRIILKNRQSQP